MPNMIRTAKYYFFSFISFTYYYFGKAYFGLADNVRCAMNA